MTNIQAFILAFIMLTIQTVTLIVFGLMFGIDGAAATFFLFVIVDVCLCACADILKIVKEK
jgi:F0F1-type ATP synthase assembly protein I